MRGFLSFIVLVGVALGTTLSVAEILNQRAGGSSPGAVVGAASAAATPGSLETLDAARNVTPGGALPGPAANGTILRREASLPVPSPKQAVPAEPLRFHKPVVVDAGQFKSGKTSILLDDVSAPGAADTCDDGQGGRWACGQRAASALRLYVRGRALDCDPLPTVDPKQKKAVKREPNAPYAGRCRVGGVDLASWLVKNGWAKPKGAAHARDAETARAAKSGLWGNGALTTASR